MARRPDIEENYGEVASTAAGDPARRGWRDHYLLRILLHAVGLYVATVGLTWGLTAAIWPQYALEFVPFSFWCPPVAVFRNFVSAPGTDYMIQCTVSYVATLCAVAAMGALRPQSRWYPFAVYAVPMLCQLLANLYLAAAMIGV